MVVHVKQERGGLDRALKVLKKKCEREGVIRAVLDHRSFETASQRRRRKHRVAATREGGR